MTRTQLGIFQGKTCKPSYDIIFLDFSHFMNKKTVLESKDVGVASTVKLR